MGFRRRRHAPLAPRSPARPPRGPAFFFLLCLLFRMYLNRMWICISTKHLQEEGVDSFVERLCYFFSIAVDIIRVKPKFVGVLFSSGAHPFEASSRFTTARIYPGGNPGGRIRHFSSPLFLLVLLSLPGRKGVMKGVLVLWSCFARFCGFAVVFRKGISKC